MGTADKPGQYGDVENSPDAYANVMYKLKSNEQMCRVAPDTGGSTGLCARGAAVAYNLLWLAEAQVCLRDGARL